MAFGSSKASTRDVNFSDLNDEYAIAAWWKPYWMQASGAAIVFGFVALMRIVQWISYHFFDKMPATGFWTWGLVICGIIACIFVYKFYARRGEQGNEVLIRFHPTVSTALGFIWMIVAFNDHPLNWMFSEVSLGLFILGAGLIAFTWMARRWSFKNFQNNDAPVANEWEALGFGETSAMGNVPVPGGRKIKIKLDPKLTTADLLEKITLIAKKFKTNAKKIRIQEDPEDPNYAYVTRFDEEPFAETVAWKGPDKPGTSIAEGIEFATYDVGGRPELFLAGKDGASCNHWLTVGMTGSGKTYGWQVIYGSVLNRRDVSLVYIDASKGVQSVMPLASGVEWFADGIEESLPVIDGIERAIKARTHHLTSKGLPHWKPGCGINFLIFHVEEAADFMGTKEVEEKLKHIARAARSAGIAVVYSLQRATNDNLPTTLREQLEGRVTFKVGNKKENTIALSGISVEAGASPHTINVKGGFYMTGPNFDYEFAGNLMRTDAMDLMDLERAVDLGAANRTPLDRITAAAFGQAYERYRAQVANNETQWQVMRSNRDSYLYENVKTESESVNEPTTEYEKYEEPVKSKTSNFTSDPAVEAEALWKFIESMNLGKFKKVDIFKPYNAATGKSKAWIYKQMDKWIDEGKLGDDAGNLFIK